MTYIPSILAFLATSALVAGAPSSALSKRTVCEFSDAASAVKGAAACDVINLNSITVPAKFSLALTGLKDYAVVNFKGPTTFVSASWAGPLVSISGNHITINGDATSPLRGNGQLIWDGHGSNIKTAGVLKPKFFFAHNLLGKSIINQLYFENSPVQTVSINNSDGLEIYGLHITNIDPNGKAHNTDAFDIGASQNIYISGAVINNQDDCVAINSGKNITFTDGFCSGGHGLSVGSVGDRAGGVAGNSVSDVYFKNTKVVNSANGVRVKTFSDATVGNVNNVNYEGITLTDITGYGVVIEEDYQNGSPTGTSKGSISIDNLNLNGIHGNVKGGQAIYINVNHATKWTWTDVQVSGGMSNTASSYKGCVGVPAGLGVPCPAKATTQST